MALAAEAQSPCHAGATSWIRLGEVVDLPLLDVPTLTIHILQSQIMKETKVRKIPKRFTGDS